MNAQISFLTLNHYLWWAYIKSGLIFGGLAFKSGLIFERLTFRSGHTLVGLIFIDVLIFGGEIIFVYIFDRKLIIGCHIYKGRVFVDGFILGE